MLGAARWSLVLALVAGWLLVPGTAHAIVPQVRDGGKFFKAQDVSRANLLIKDIEKKYKKDVVVETFGEISDENAKKFQYDPKNRPAFYASWRDSIAEGGAINGIVVLIVKDQHNENKTHIEVGVGKETQKRAFTPTNAKELFNILNDNFSIGQPGQGLLHSLKFINDTLASHQAREGAPIGVQKQTPARADQEVAGSGILGWVCIGLCVLAGIWLVAGLFRAFSGGAGSAGGPGYGYGGGGGGGGGFMSGLFGGLFGAMAGNWLYSTMFGGHSYHQSSWGDSSASASDTQSAAKDDFGPSDEGQGFSGTGGDVDPGGGSGGDVGGGDAGGDWGGGGDAGGGGGDWGGGGGDWGGGGDVGGGGGDW